VLISWSERAKWRSPGIERAKKMAQKAAAKITIARFIQQFLQSQ
jgi:hypothetical protein